MGHSSNAKLFKSNQLLPIRDLKLLVRDYAVCAVRNLAVLCLCKSQPIAKNALTILVNISSDEEVLNNLAKDDKFVEDLLRRITDMKDSSANEVAMLLSNLAKSDSIDRLIALKRVVSKDVSTSKIAIDQLVDCFVKGAEGKLNKNADFDYLSYFFADISKHEVGRKYLVAKQEYDGVVPITKLTVFTEHKSLVRRRGVASTIKNVAFDIASHPMLLADEGANLLPYILLPLAGNEELSDEDTEGMLADLMLLPPDKERDKDHGILVIHLETLLLLTTTREGRDLMRQVKVYPIIRECHLHVEDESVRDSCDRLVQVLLRDEEGEGEGEGAGKEPPDPAGEVGEDDDKIVEVF